MACTSKVLLKLTIVVNIVQSAHNANGPVEALVEKTDHAYK
jgi:hypothetical protein